MDGARPDLAVPDLDAAPVFVNLAGGTRFAPWRPGSVYDLVGRLRRDLSGQVPASWSPHWMRHSHATALLLSGVPPHVVSRGSGTPTCRRLWSCMRTSRTTLICGRPPGGGRSPRAGGPPAGRTGAGRERDHRRGADGLPGSSRLPPRYGCPGPFAGLGAAGNAGAAAAGRHGPCPLPGRVRRGEPARDRDRRERPSRPDAAGGHLVRVPGHRAGREDPGAGCRHAGAPPHRDHRRRGGRRPSLADGPDPAPGCSRSPWPSTAGGGNCPPRRR